MVPSTYVSGAGFNMLPNLMLTRFLWEKYYYYPHFTDKKLRHREVKQVLWAQWNQARISNRSMTRKFPNVCYWNNIASK